MALARRPYQDAAWLAWHNHALLALPSPTSTVNRFMDIDARIPDAPKSWHNDRLHFFKYMTAATARIVLTNRTLRWSTASVLNDPFDMQFDMSVAIDPDRLRSAALSKMWQLYASQQPTPAKNPAGGLMELLRRSSPKLTRDEFDREFGPAMADG
jgi:hypothetical protein